MRILNNTPRVNPADDFSALAFEDIRALRDEVARLKHQIETLQVLPATPSAPAVSQKPAPNATKTALFDPLWSFITNPVPPK